MSTLDCSSLRLLCLLAPYLSTIALVVFTLFMVGFGVGWWGTKSSESARTGFEVLVLMILGLTIGVNWADDQGNPWWLLARIPALLGPLVVAAVLPASLAVSVGATLREDVEVPQRVGRLILILALIPIGYLTIFHSGVWPSRTTKAHMVTVFHRYRFVFDRIADKYVASLPETCRPLCASKPAPTAPVDPELQLMFWWLGAGAGYWQTDGNLYLPWWNVGGGLLGGEVRKGYKYTPIPPSPLLDDIETAPLYKAGSRAYYQHLGGDWYLVWASD